MSNCSTYEVLKQAYLSLAESYLRHGITAWGSSTYCRLLQQSQNRLLKLLWKNKQHLSNTTNNHNPNIRTNQSNNQNPIETRKSKSNKTLVNTNNLPKHLQILNIKHIYYSTLANEFFESSYLHKIVHTHNTRMRAEGRYKVPQYKNNYGRSTLDVTLPKIFNMIPISILSIKNKYTRKKHIKKYFLELQ